MNYFLFFFLLFSSCLNGAVDEGNLLFLIHHGKQEEAWKIYLADYEERGSHRFHLLQRMSLTLLDYGYRQNDPEAQLLALFGATFSSNEEALHLLEKGMRNPNPQIQLAAIKGLAAADSDLADRALLKAVSSPHLALRYQAVSELCEKKHPQAVHQAESLMYKTPKFVLEIYPSLFAKTGDSRSNYILKKLLNNASPQVRLAVILQAAKYQREDLIPQLRQQLAQSGHLEQEAAATALGLFKDEASKKKLEELTQSQHTSVSIAAALALYRLGNHQIAEEIEKRAAKKELFALYALGKIEKESPLLENLTHENDLDLRLNALLALLEKKNEKGIEEISKLLIDRKGDYGFKIELSPGGSLHYWRVVPHATKLFEEDFSLQQADLELKSKIIKKIRYVSPEAFIRLADLLFTHQKNSLIPLTVTLLEEIGSKEAIACLINHQQQFGAPLVRNYCTLALYRLKVEGPWGEQVREWIKNQSKTEFISFKPLPAPLLGEKNYSLTPEEKSRFLIHALESVAQSRSNEAIATMIEAIAFGHDKNKYAIAGLLLRATE